MPVLTSVCRESYSEPRAVYMTLKRRGMTLVTVTDHDSIDAVEPLRSQPDFFLSEEVTATSPSGTQMHIGVYDIQEYDHTEIQRRRDDLMSLIAYLHEHQLFFTINHVYSGLTGRRTESDFALFARYFPGIEALNGQIIGSCNQKATELAACQAKSITGGSDAHTLTSLGRTYTEVPGADNKTEFMEGLRIGRVALHGESGSYWKLTRAVCTLGSQMMRENPWTLLLLPALLAVPLATMATCLRDLAFTGRWASKTCVPMPPVQGLSQRWVEGPDYSEARP